MSGKYDDMLHLPHHISLTRRRMTMAERAAQFSPFAALAGHEDAIQETSRVVGRRFDLSEEEKAVLDRKQQIILGFLKQGEQPMVTVTYFRPDRKKAGGEYVKRTGKVKKVREVENSLVFADGVEIPFLILPI
jgi:hypothetical protein